jgi:tetratricopeptide (TPR) repeat protein
MWRIAGGFAIVVLAACTLAGQTLRERAWGQANIKGLQLLWSGDYHGAEKLLAQVVREAASVWQGDPRLAVISNNLAYVYAVLGEYGKAEKLYLRAAGIWERSGAENDAKLADCLNNLATLYLETGQYTRAERLLGRTIDAHGSSLGLKHPLMASLFGNLGMAYSGQGKDSEAETHYLRALAIFGPDSSGAATTLNNLGTLYMKRQRWADGRSYLERALAALKKSSNTHVPTLVKTLLNLSSLAILTGRWVEAEELAQRALQTAEGSLGGDHLLVAAALCNHAVVLRKTHRTREAKQVESRAKAILAERAGKDPARHAVDFADLVRAARRRR